MPRARRPAVKDATGGVPDVVVEHAGAETWKTSLTVARFGGRVVVCALGHPPRELGSPCSCSS
ncbi:MAG: zinc-binding dehydrogenase, partial [Candidatus Doudnabacteria bacterium]